MKHILTVCVGNICRSPLAQALVKQQLPDHEVSSAGLSALVGEPADPIVVQLAAAHGIDLEAHRAQQVAEWMCRQADLILVMEQGHKARLERRFPQVRGKVFRLGHFRGIDIADPYQHSAEAFNDAWYSIREGASDWVPRIRKSI